ncbi:MAG TPA: TonB-dependent receptor [Bacteroidales bacterium]|nr:TonB-dependent receptor [Bacteroidales bacterium]
MRQLHKITWFAKRIIPLWFCLFSLCQPLIPQTANQKNYLPIDQLIDQMEYKYGIQVFYKPEWFENLTFPPTLLNLSFKEAIERIVTKAELSVITIDSALYIFIPVKQISNHTQQQEKSDAVVIGDPDDYGKYTRATIRGRIIDGKDGTPLPGASILIDKLKIGVNTDKEGHFQIQAPVGEHTVRLSFMGYDDNIQKVKLVSNGTIDFELYEKAIKLGEVVIYSDRPESNVTGTRMSIVKLDIKEIKELPVSIGGKDIIKSITLMPGVQTIGEFGTGFNVRGGGSDQNLILIEDVPIFNLSHLLGLISVINSDGISSVTLLKAGIPAKYGERASSVIDIRMGASNPDKTTIKG